MKKFLIAFLILLSFALLAYAQTEAGFLDSPPPPNPQDQVVFSGNGWYCIGNFGFPYDDDYLVAGPFQSQPDCSIY